MKHQVSAMRTKDKLDRKLTKIGQGDRVIAAKVLGLGPAIVSTFIWGTLTGNLKMQKEISDSPP